MTATVRGAESRASQGRARARARARARSVQSLAALLAVISFAFSGAAPAAARPIVAYVDVPDRYTDTAGLAAWLAGTGRVQAVDVTEAVRRGRLGLRRSRAFIVGSFATSAPEVRAGLERAKGTIRRFLRAGGTVIVLAQADEDEAAVRWLPPGLAAVRGERDADTVRVDGAAEHPLLRRPHALKPAALAGWTLAAARVERASSVLSVTDAFVRLEGFRTIAAVDAPAAFPVVAVAAVGRGRVVLVQLAPDRAAALGPDEPSRAAAGQLLDNLLDYGLRRHAAPGRRGREADDARPDKPYRAPEPAPVTVRVFRDDDGDGARDDGEPSLAGVAVTHAFRVLETDGDGSARFAVDPAEPGWLAVTIPDGHAATTPWWVDAWAPAAAAGEVWFGLRPLPAPAPAPPGGAAAAGLPRPLVLAQLTDVHLGAKPLSLGRALLRDALAVVTAHDPPVDVVLVTGDLTASGSPAELQAYREELAALPGPVLHAMGNHDLSRGPDGGMPYQRALGPWAYDVEHAGYRFVVLYQRATAHPSVAWARERIARSPLPVVLVVHHWPRRALLDALLAPNVVAVLSGDWHDAEVRRLPGGAVDVNSAPTLFGGWDHSPAAVRFVRVDGARAPGRGPGPVVETELRYLRLPEHLAIVLPEAVAAAPRQILVQAYDSRAEVRRVSFGLRPAPVAGADGAAGEGEAAAGPARARGSLRRCGTWAWCGELPAPLPPGRYTLDAQAEAADGRRWSARRAVTVEEAAPGPAVAAAGAGALPGAAPAPDWPTFRGDGARSGHARAALGPPLRVAWASAAGGEVYAGGPVVADGVVVLSLMDRATVAARNAGVAAFDLADGRPLWRFATGSSVRHSPAIARGLVVFQQTDGATVALDLRTGAERWRHDLAAAAPPPYAGYYALGGPLVHRGRVYVGPLAAPRVLDLASGAVVATLPALDGQPAVTYASPLRFGRLVLWPARNRGLLAFAARPRGGTLRPAWRAPGLRLSATPVVADDAVYALAHDALYVVDARRGRVRDRFAVPAGASAASPVVDERAIYVPAADGALLALDRTTGERLWRFETGPAQLDFLLYRANGRGHSSSPLLSGELLFFGGHDGWVRAVDRRTGAAVWSFAAGLPVPSAPALAGDTLLIADHGGVLYAFRPTPAR